MTLRRYISFLPFGLIALGCHFGAEREVEIPEDPVAEVDGNYLTKSDLEGIGRGLDKEDSIAMVNFYIEEWIKEQLLVQKAREIMPEEDLDFNRQVQKYENDLVLEAYMSELKFKADTNVSNVEIKSYFEEQIENYRLDENLYRLNFVMIPSSSPVIDSIYNWLSEEGSEAKLKISNRAESFSGQAMLDDSLWINNSTLTNWVPASQETLDSYEEGLVKVYLKDGASYLIRILERKVEGDYAPLDYLEDEIKGIIIAQKQREYINNTFNKVFEEGKNKKLFTRYQ